MYHSSPDGHKQLHELFDLLCFAPSRWLLLGLASPWEKASQAEINAMLEHCSQGRLEMQRAIANALCRVTKMTWYLQLKIGSKDTLRLIIAKMELHPYATSVAGRYFFLWKRAVIADEPAVVSRVHRCTYRSKAAEQGYFRS